MRLPPRTLPQHTASHIAKPDRTGAARDRDEAMVDVPVRARQQHCSAAQRSQSQDRTARVCAETAEGDTREDGEETLHDGGRELVHGVRE
eukprot:1784768-Rhodomonas_salina.1